MSIQAVLEKLTKIEERFEGRFDALEEKIDGITKRVDLLEERVNVVEKKNEKLTLLEKKYKDAIERTKIAGVMTEFKSRELNVIINNVAQTDEEEKSTDSLAKAQSVIRDVLKVEESVEITHAHRLPKGGSALRRPLIIKVASMFEKDKLWSKIKNVQLFNDGKEKEDKIYVEMVHLPNKLFIDKMSLKDDFKRKKRAGKKPYWRLDSQNGEYCYKVGGVWYRPDHRDD